MSLINQALRKAQNQRTPTRASTAAEQANVAQPSQPARTNNLGLLIGLIAGIVILIGIVAGLTIVVLNKEPAPAVQQTAQVPAPTSTAPTPSPTATTPAEPRQLAPLTPPAAAPASTPQEQQATPGVLEELRIAREAAEAKAAADAAAAEKAEAEALAAKEAAEAEALAAKQAAEAAAAAKPSQDIIQWLSEAKVTGVRISPKGNKVILNNKAYSVGDSVNIRLGLKVLIIQEKRILFVDANGKKYLKQI